MKKHALLLVISILTTMEVYSQSVGFKLYNSKGKEVSIEQMAKEMGKADVALLGELHNDPVSHFVQLRITQILHENTKKVVLGAEMFEADNQLLINEYVSGKIKTSNFEKEAKLWPNYQTDYKPLVEFARNNELNFIATNIPRRYASVVAKNGFEGLKDFSEEAKQYIADLPIDFDTAAPGYAEMMQMGMGHGIGMDPINMVRAQAIKDATMSQFIIDNLPKKGIFIHFQGDYHSARKGGIYWYIKKTNSKIQVSVLSTVSASSIEWRDEYSELADFILVVDKDMTKTY